MLLHTHVNHALYQLRTLLCSTIMSCNRSLKDGCFKISSLLFLRIFTMLEISLQRRRASSYLKAVYGGMHCISHFFMFLVVVDVHLVAVMKLMTFSNMQ